MYLSSNLALLDTRARHNLSRRTRLNATTALASLCQKAFPFALSEAHLARQFIALFGPKVSSFLNCLVPKRMRRLLKKRWRKLLLRERMVCLLNWLSFPQDSLKCRTATELAELGKETAAIKEIRSTMNEPGSAKRVFDKVGLSCRSSRSS